MREPVIVDVVRTTFGKRGGALANWHPADLLGFALTTLIERTGVDPERIDDVIGGCVSQVGEQSTNLARNGWVSAGLPQTVPATTVDRQCGSSQQAVHFAAAGVAADHYDLVIACGAEVMSRVPLASNAAGRHRTLPALVHGGGGRTTLDPVPGQPGPGRPLWDHAPGDGRLCAGVPPAGGRELGQRTLRTRSGGGAHEGGGRQPDRGIPPHRRRHPALFHH